jgi:hypothetical protein
VLEKIDVRQIITEHVGTFRDYGTKHTSISDYVLFFGVPVGVAGLSLWLRLGLTVNAVNGLLTAFSIFAGLLFNLLVMVLTFLQSTQGSAADKMLVARKELLRQISANLSFAILSSLAIVAVAIFALASTDQIWVPRLAVFLLLLGSVNFTLTLLMILKRMYALLMNDFDRHKLNKVA